MNPNDTPSPGPGSPKRPARTSRAARGKPAKKPRAAARKPARAKVPPRKPSKSVNEWIDAAHAEPNTEQTEAIYTEALAEWPRNTRLLTRAAFHLESQCRDRAGAEALYRRALALQPRSQHATECLTDFLCEKRGGWREAAEILRARLRRNPRDRFALNRLAVILTDHPRDFDAAERLYRRSVRLAPREPFALRNLAEFLLEVRKDADAVERIHLRILRLRSAGAYDIANHAKFLCEVRGDYAAAERHYRQACAHPRARPPVRMELGRFLIIYRGRYEEGEAILARDITEERKAASGLSVGSRGFDTIPTTRSEWIHQVEWCALLSNFNAEVAEHYALLKRMRPEFFPEER